MGKYMNPGNIGFRDIRNGIYVDKSGLIQMINDSIGTKRKLTCISRPRRFGKSFAAQMLCAYYDCSCDSRALFADLQIAECEDFAKHLNRYNVIYLDITSFLSRAKRSNGLLETIVQDIVDSIEKELREMLPAVSHKITFSELLLSCVEYTGRQIVFIIDEWDAIIREAKDMPEVQERYLNLLRELFKNGNFTDKIVAAAYLTGILPIKKNGTQSAITDFKEYTMLRPGKFARYVGFTEEEVRGLCREYAMDFERMKAWYDGYTFTSQTSVYNPNSVIEAVHEGEYDSYWSSSETYESLKDYIEMDLDGIQQAMIQMLGGASVKVDPATFQNDMDEAFIRSKDDVLTLLIHLGYLAFDNDSQTVYIPNEEIRREIVSTVRTGGHRDSARLLRNSDQLLTDTVAMRADKVAQAIEEAHRAGTAPLYYNNEQALRAVIKAAYISAIDEYIKVEELPSGTGYADVVYLPKKTSSLPALVVELKWNKPVQSAIAQMKDRHYPEVFKGYGGEILLVGIVYDADTKAHRCKIEKYEM